MVAWPLTRLDICVMSDGAAATILVSEEGLTKLEAAGAKIARPLVKVTGIGRGTDAMRMADRPHFDYDTFMSDYATEQEKASDETRAYYKKLWDHGTRYPGVHSFRAGRTAGNMAYKHAGISDPLGELDFVELHDAYTSSEIQTYEDLGLCRYGEGGTVRRFGQSFSARHRLRPEPARETGLRRQPIWRADRLRTSRRRDRADAGGLRHLAVAGGSRTSI